MSAPETTNAYTDADVQAATAELVEAPLENSEAQDVRLILDAVAPAIAARALRDAADEFWIESLGKKGATVGEVARAQDWIRARADEIEAGR